MSNPFASPPTKSGHGSIHLALVSPNIPRLAKSSYQYPLKLVSPAPSKANNDEISHLIHTIYLLTYGCGLVAGDTINLDVNLESSTRLILLTQGSTKLFKSPSRDVRSTQCMTAYLDPGSALCYLPDPVQPFENSCFEQTQIYNINAPTETGKPFPSLCALDWVSNGRPANGENWSFFRYGSRNEVFLCLPDGNRRLILRDNMLLDDNESDGSVVARMAGLSVFGTLILNGPLFQGLGQFFMDEFKNLPRIGGRKWDTGSDDGEEEPDAATVRRATRHRQEASDGVLWSAASVRGVVVVKFGAPELESARRWTRDMLIEDGCVEREFGERALLCLR